MTGQGDPTVHASRVIRDTGDSSTNRSASSQPSYHSRSIDPAARHASKALKSGSPTSRA